MARAFRTSSLSAFRWWSGCSPKCSPSMYCSNIASIVLSDDKWLSRLTIATARSPSTTNPRGVSATNRVGDAPVTLDSVLMIAALSCPISNLGRCLSNGTTGRYSTSSATSIARFTQAAGNFNPSYVSILTVNSCPDTKFPSTSSTSAVDRAGCTTPSVQERAIDRGFPDNFSSLARSAEIKEHELPLSRTASTVTSMLPHLTRTGRVLRKVVVSSP